MSLVNVEKIIISKMTAHDIEDVVKIEAEAYGKHHWSKSSFYDEMNNNLVTYRKHGTQQQITVSIEEFVKLIKDHNENLN